MENRCVFKHRCITCVFSIFILVHTPLSCISVYFDQIVAIVLALGMMKEPIQMIGESFRSLMLLSPDEKEVTKIKNISSSVLDNYPYDPVFYDITTTGRKCGYPSISQHELI